MSTQDADGDIKILEAKVVILGNTGTFVCHRIQFSRLLLNRLAPFSFAGVGKTSIVTKYVNNQFSPLTPATIGASFNIKSVYVLVDCILHFFFTWSNN
jgi:hypothetical protein